MFLISVALEASIYFVWDSLHSHFGERYILRDLESVSMTLEPLYNLLQLAHEPF